MFLSKITQKGEIIPKIDLLSNFFILNIYNMIINLNHCHPSSSNQPYQPNQFKPDYFQSKKRTFSLHTPFNDSS